MMVLTSGNGVNGFTPDRDIAEFILTHPDMTTPAQTREFAINASNMRLWEVPVRRHVDECLAGAEGPPGEDYNMRWIASRVAEVQRILTRGGILMYRVHAKIKVAGVHDKLRLMYEADPMSFIVGQAGGMSSTGREPLMELNPCDLHQRVPVVLGSCDEVERVVAHHSA